MSSNIDISFMVTPSQKKTIDLRADENGFDDAISYIKVVALKTQKFTPKPISLYEEPSIELTFNINESQKKTLDENLKSSTCRNLETYLRYVTVHAVVTAVLEVRSTGSLDDMLSRISASKKN